MDIILEPLSHITQLFWDFKLMHGIAWSFIFYLSHFEAS